MPAASSRAAEFGRRRCQLTLVVRARFGELAIDVERLGGEALLQVQLGHRLRDEWRRGLGGLRRASDTSDARRVRTPGGAGARGLCARGSSTASVRPAGVSSTDIGGCRCPACRRRGARRRDARLERGDTSASRRGRTRVASAPASSDGAKLAAPGRSATDCGSARSDSAARPELAPGRYIGSGAAHDRRGVSDRTSPRPVGLRERGGYDRHGGAAFAPNPPAPSATGAASVTGAASSGAAAARSGPRRRAASLASCAIRAMISPLRGSASSTRSYQPRASTLAAVDASRCRRGGAAR